MAKKAAAPATITLKHLAADIAESQDLSKKHAEAVLTEMIDLITRHLKKGDRVRIVRLGVMIVRGEEQDPWSFEASMHHFAPHRLAGDRDAAVPVAHQRCYTAETARGVKGECGFALRGEEEIVCKLHRDLQSLPDRAR